MGAFGAGREFFFVFWIILPLGNTSSASAVLNPTAIHPKRANIHCNALLLFSVLAYRIFFHALPLPRDSILFLPRLFIRGLHVAIQFRLYLQPFGCRVLVSAALRFSQYAVSRYTFRSLPRSARLGIVHCWSSTEFSRFMGLL